MKEKPSSLEFQPRSCSGAQAELLVSGRRPSPVETMWSVPGGMVSPQRKKFWKGAWILARHA
jgi:hypothetical protein